MGPGVVLHQLQRPRGPYRRFDRVIAAAGKSSVLELERPFRRRGCRTCVEIRVDISGD